MDSWVIGQVSFWYTVYGKQIITPKVSTDEERPLSRCGMIPLFLPLSVSLFPTFELFRGRTLEIKPAVIVDKIIKFWLDLNTPGRGAGESDWYV